ncbi:beta-glucosidase BglX [Chryseobacterium gambrini]|uniref:beta-glucosidase BglX n=1 Tax=Chryseobacterium gambrini TaxID=373672 RepID=UPI0022F1B899|nr:beta-glucosidase BglX [Chryseobacterium gambrini]WBV53655.1 beta-glucosidase BglX [Chryseobacterium gambrini]
MKITKIVIITIISIITVNTVSAQQKLNPETEKKINVLMSKMTLEEKVGQMNQYNGFWDVTGPAPVGGSAEEKYENIKKGLVGSMLTVRGVKEVKAVQKIAVEQTRLGIPLIIGFDVIHGYKTISPIPLAEAASWDLKAIEKSAEVAASEAAASGINWTFGPMMDISRDARWGRVMEGAGEDPFLGGKIAAARVKGFQGDNTFRSPLRIAATAKHFAAYGFVEAGLEYNAVEIGNNTLFNQVLPPFKSAVDAGIRSVMNSFNTINGTPATADRYLLRDVLKNKWNFSGFVVSDWASIREMISWGFSKDEKAAAKSAVEAGTDMDMESGIYFPYLIDLVKQGKVKESYIDDAVRRILRVKFELGLFDDPYRFLDEKREKETIGSTANHEAVLDMAKKSIVLLKNEKNLLPLKKSGQKILLLGSLAESKNSPLGSWRIAADNNTAVSVLEGMKAYKGNQLNFVEGPKLTTSEPTFLTEVNYNTTDRKGLEEAKNAAKNADVIVMVLGEHGFSSGEARSRTNIDLPGLQEEFLKEIFKVNPNIVLVLNNGRPLTINWASENIPAIVEAWHLGTQAGNAVSQVLYGDYNPSGKLPMTFPRNVGQIPVYYNHLNTGRPFDKDKNVFWSHYSDVEKTPLYPFGFGLSYTKFEYSDLKINKKLFSKGENIQVTFTLKNTGKYDGREVAQLYIQDEFASVARPVKELKGFQIVELKSGESKKITFNLTEKELGFYDNSGNFIVEEGAFKVMVGGNSESVISDEFSLE